MLKVKLNQKDPDLQAIAHNLRNLLTVKQAAEKLNISPQAVKQAIKDKRLAAISLGESASSSKYLLTKEAVKNYKPVYGRGRKGSKITKATQAAAQSADQQNQPTIEQPLAA